MTGAFSLQDSQANLGVEHGEEGDGHAEQREQEGVVDGGVDGASHGVVCRAVGAT